MFCFKWPSILILLPLFAAFSAPSDQFDDIIEQVVPRNEISNAQLKALRDELKIQRIFIEGVKGIELNGGEFKNITKASQTIEELIISSFEARSASVPSHVKKALKQTVRDSVSKNAIERTLIKLRNFVYNQASSRKVMLTSVARRWGFDVGLVYLLTLQVDLTFPSVMIAMGHMEFAPLLATPLSSMATGTYASLKSAVRMGHLVKSLGGLSSAREHLNVYRKVKDFFKTTIFTNYEIIDLDVAGKNYVFSIEKQNLLTRFKQKLGWNRRLNYHNLLEFMETENLMPSVIQRVLDSERPDEVKLLRLLHRIEIENNEEVMTKLKSKFGDFIQEMDNLPEFTAGRQWSAKISNVKTFDDFGRMMMNIPDDIPPRVFDKLWRNHILPRASKTIGPYMDKDTYKAFRNMERDWGKNFRKIMAESVDTSLDERWRMRLADYFFEALAPVNGCGAVFTKRGQYAPLL